MSVIWWQAFWVAAYLGVGALFGMWALHHDSKRGLWKPGPVLAAEFTLTAVAWPAFLLLGVAVGVYLRLRLPREHGPEEDDG